MTRGFDGRVFYQEEDRWIKVDNMLVHALSLSEMTINPANDRSLDIPFISGVKESSFVRVAVLREMGEVGVVDYQRRSDASSWISWITGPHDTLSAYDLYCFFMMSSCCCNQSSIDVELNASFAKVLSRD